MTHYFMREDKKIIEFSDSRLSDYKKLKELWKSSNKRAALEKVANHFLKKDYFLDQMSSDSTTLARDHLRHLSMFSMPIVDIEFLGALQVLDKDFLEFIFTKNPDSYVLHFSKLTVVEILKLMKEKDVIFFDILILPGFVK
jgi:hypothetical protein